jgi:glycosyltransferase involved in cell wall biosynthesis
MSRRVIISVDQLSRPQPGGIASYVAGLFRGLAEVGDDQYEALGPRAALDRLASWPSLCTPVPQRLLPQVWRSVAAGVPHGVSVVHATSMAGPFDGAAVRQTVALHDLLWRDMPSDTTARGVRFHEDRLQYLVERDDIRLLVTSPLLAPRLINLGVNPERLYPIRLGVDDAGITPANVTEVRAHLLSVGVRGPFTLHAGTREPRKNVERLVRSHAAARQREPELGPLVFVGPTGWGSTDSGDAVVLGMVSRELLLGLYREATLVAYVPHAEGFGLPPVEALRAGTRVVASSTCPSVFTNDEVIVVDPFDEEAITDGLCRSLSLATDEAARERRRASVASMTWRNCALDHLAAWS